VFEVVALQNAAFAKSGLTATSRVSRTNVAWRILSILGKLFWVAKKTPGGGQMHLDNATDQGLDRIPFLASSLFKEGTRLHFLLPFYLQKVMAIL